MTASTEPGLNDRVFRFMLLYRWGSLLPALVVLLMSAGSATENPRLFLVFGLAVLDNLALTVFLRPLNDAVTSRPAFIVIDLVFGAALIALTGGWQSPYYLYALSPLLGAALLISMRGALAAATLFGVLYLGALAADVNLFGSTVNTGQALTQFAGIFLVAGLFGYPGVLVRRLRQARDALAESHRELESLHRLALAMQSSAVSVVDVQEQILGSVTGTLGFERATLAIADPDNHVLVDWLFRRRGAGDTKPTKPFRAAEIPICSEGGIISRALVERRPLLVRDNALPTADSALDQWLDLKSYAVLPMIMRDHPVGVLVVDNPDSGRSLTDRDLASLAALANQAAMVLGSTMVCTDRTRRLTVEEERNRIALEIHDAVSQSLFGMVFTLDACAKMLPDQAATVQERLVELRGVASQVMTEVRRFIFDLWPGDLNEQTFEAGLYAYARELAPLPALHFEIDVTGCFVGIDGITRKQLYRLAQEGLSNIVRHAGATVARVHLDLGQEEVRLTVQDNGRGFDPTAVPAPGTHRPHLGLTAMRERTHLLGGSLTIDSAPGCGTRVVVVVPRPRLTHG